MLDVSEYHAIEDEYAVKNTVKGRPKKELYGKRMLDYSVIIAEVFPSFSEEGVNNKRLMNKILHCATLMYEEEEDEDRSYMILASSLKNLKSDYRSAVKLLEKYPVFVCVDDFYYKSFRGADGNMVKGQAKKWEITTEGLTIMRMAIKYVEMMSEEVMVLRKKGVLWTLTSKIDTRTLKEEDFDYSCMCQCNVDDVDIDAVLDDPMFKRNPLVANTLVRSLLNKGELRQYYSRNNFGRLYGLGPYSVQRIKKSMRKLLMKGMYDYDFQNAHFVIAAHIGGSQCPTIKNYAENSKFIRNFLYEALRHNSKKVTEETIKKSLLMLLYGARRSLHKENSIVEALGKNAAKEFFAHPFVEMLCEDIDRLHTLMLEYGFIRERLDKKSREVSKVLQHYEAKMLDACIAEVEPTALYFDGFTSYEDVPVYKLEQIIYNAVGISITVTKEKI